LKLKDEFFKRQRKEKEEAVKTLKLFGINLIDIAPSLKYILFILILSVICFSLIYLLNKVRKPKPLSKKQK